METPTIYTNYADIQHQIDVLEEKKELLRKEIAEQLKDEGETFNFGTFFWTKKKKYTYSPEVVGLEAKIKETKKREEENGVATVEEVKQLTIKLK